MASTFTTRLGLEKIATGEKENTWGSSERSNQDLLDQFLAGVGTVNVGGAIDVTLTKAQWADAVIVFTGELLANINVVLPTIEKPWKIKNGTTGSFTLTFKTSGGSGPTITQGSWADIYGDGTDVQVSVQELVVGTNVQADLDVPSQAEAEAGTSTDERVWTAERIAEAIAALTVSVIESGTVMLFQQEFAPTDWTKEAVHNNKALRVVTGVPGSGGATSFTSVFGSGKNTGAHQLTVAEMPEHTHTVDNQSAMNPGENAVLNARVTGSQQSAPTGGNDTHAHTLSLDVQYVDLILATKD